LIEVEWRQKEARLLVFSSRRSGFILGGKMIVKLGEKEYDIQPLNLNDWVNLESKVGRIDKLGQDLSISSLRHILTYVLKKSDPQLTEEQVGSMFVPGSEDFNLLIKKIFAQKEEDTENPT